MPKQQEGQQDTGQEEQGGRQLGPVIGRHVLHALGRPGDLQSVQVRPLWEHYYRVNVFVGPDGASARIANSYFVAADGAGNILASTPQITRQY